MTNDYIRKQDAVERMVDVIINEFDVGITYAYTLTEDGLNLPSADVVTVVHARWEKSDSYIDRYDETIEILICKSCGFKHHYCQGDTSMTDAGWFHFCPNCGAKMDREE